MLELTKIQKSLKIVKLTGRASQLYKNLIFWAPKVKIGEGEPKTS